MANQDEIDLTKEELDKFLHLYRLLEVGDILSKQEFTNKKDRHRFIKNFYNTLTKGETKRKVVRIYNNNAKIWIIINLSGIKETAQNASSSSQSTKMIIKTFKMIASAIPINDVPIKSNTKSQQKYKYMRIFECNIANHPEVKMVIGAKEVVRNKVKVIDYELYSLA